MSEDSWLQRMLLSMNLLLWLAAIGVAYGEPDIPSMMRGVVTAGLIFSAVGQHWAYNRRKGVRFFRLWPAGKHRP